MSTKEELRKKLNEKIQGKKIDRSNKHTKTKILDQSLKDMGIDKQRLAEDIKKVNQQGGLEIKKKIS